MTKLYTSFNSLEEAVNWLLAGNTIVNGTGCVFTVKDMESFFNWIGE